MQNAISSNAPGGRLLAKQSSSNVRRAAEILVILGSAGPAGMSLSALANAIGDTKPAIHRALVALSEFGMATQAGRRGNYRLGPAIYALAHRTPSIQDMVTAFRPVLISISAETGLSSFLMVRSGLDSVCLDFQSGAMAAPALFDGVGGRLPLGVGLSGVCVLGMMEKNSRDKIIQANAKKLGEWNVTAEQIRAEIEAFEQAGYVRGIRSAMGIEIMTLSIPAETVDLFSYDAAISVIAPVNWLNEDAIPSTVEAMKRCLHSLTETNRGIKVV